MKTGSGCEDNCERYNQNTYWRDGEETAKHKKWRHEVTEKDNREMNIYA